MERWLAQHGDAPAAERRKLLRQLCHDYGLRTQQGAAYRTCREASETPSEYDANGMNATLKGVPSVRAIGSARIPLSWNDLGSQSAPVTVNGVTLPWFMDTGAEISVVAQSNADRIGVRYVGDGVRVGTTTAPVMGRIGVIDMMRIGEASVENVPVLVLPDRQLTIKGVGSIPAVLGLQVFNAFRRMAWVDGGKTLALGEAAPAITAPTGRIYWHNAGLGIEVRTPLGVRGAHFDSGANTTEWRPGGLALLEPTQLGGAKVRRGLVGGAGGTVSVAQRELPELSFQFGGAAVRLTKVRIDDASNDSAARVGMDAVTQLDTLILDFERMTVFARPKTAGVTTP